MHENRAIEAPELNNYHVNKKIIKIYAEWDSTNSIFKFNTQSKTKISSCMDANNVSWFLVHQPTNPNTLHCQEIIPLLHSLSTLKKFIFKNYTKEDFKVT